MNRSLDAGRTCGGSGFRSSFLNVEIKFIEMRQFEMHSGRDGLEGQDGGSPILMVGPFTGNAQGNPVDEPLKPLTTERSKAYPVGLHGAFKIDETPAI